MKVTQLSDLGLIVVLLALLGRISISTALLVLVLTGELSFVT